MRMPSLPVCMCGAESGDALCAKPPYHLHIFTSPIPCHFYAQDVQLLRGISGTLEGSATF